MIKNWLNRLTSTETNETRSSLDIDLSQLDIQKLPILAFDQLCEISGIDANLSDWRRLCGVNTDQFDALYKDAFVRFAESIQLAPASEAHHHCGPGGLLTHTYETITLALRRREGLKLPVGATIAEIHQKQHLWTCAVFAACLLHDIGKVMASTRIKVLLDNGSERFWTPHGVPLTQLPGAQSYAIEFVKTPYKYHNLVSQTLFDILPRSARAWLANDQKVMTELCAHLQGDRFESGTIGELAEGADMESTRRNLQLPMPTKRFSNTIPLIDRYLGWIRDWIRDGSIRTNVNGALLWVDNDGYAYFVCRTLAEKLVAQCDELNINDTPRDPIRIYDILQEHGYALSTPENKAVWTITVKGEDFEHAFTCLKFEARRLSTPTKPLTPFEGEITIGKIVKKAKASPAPEETESKQAAQAATVAPIPATETQDTQVSEAGKELPDNEEALENVQKPDGKMENQEADVVKTPAAATAIASPDADAKLNEDVPESVQKVSLVFGTAKRVRESKKINEAEIEPENKTSENETRPTENIANQTITAINELQQDHQEAEPIDTVSNTLVSDAAQAPEADDSVIETVDTIEAADTVSSMEETKPDAVAAQAAIKIIEDEAGSPIKTSVNVDETEASDLLPIYTFQGLTIENPEIHKVFFDWLCKNLIEKRYRINTRTSTVHIVQEGVLILAPGVFKEFLSFHGLDPMEHRRLSKKFDRYKKHRRNSDNTNIVFYAAEGKNRVSRLSGRIIPFNKIYPDNHPIPQPNKYLKKIDLSKDKLIDSL